MGANCFRRNKRIIQQYIKEAKRYPPLEKEEEKILIQKVRKGSRTAINRLIQSNLMFVLKIAYKYQNQGMEFEDIISAGNIGLLNAAFRINPAMNNKFITYAVWWIRQSMRYAIFNQSRFIRLASSKEEKIRQLFKNSPPMKSYIGGYETDWETLQKSLGDDIKDLPAIMRFAEPPISFESRIGSEENLSLKDILACHDPNPDEAFQVKEVHCLLEEAAQSLEKREIEILKEYYGLAHYQHQSLAEIGKSKNLSKERIRQIKDQAIKKLKTILVERFAYSSAA